MIHSLQIHLAEDLFAFSTLITCKLQSPRFTAASPIIYDPLLCYQPAAPTILRTSSPFTRFSVVIRGVPVSGYKFIHRLHDIKNHLCAYLGWLKSKIKKIIPNNPHLNTACRSRTRSRNILRPASLRSLCSASCLSFSNSSSWPHILHHVPRARLHIFRAGKDHGRHRKTINLLCVCLGG